MSKAILFCAAIFCAVCLSAKDLKVLMIGNSFSQSVLNQLPAVVKAEKKHNLQIAQMMIGGCVLSNHAAQLEKALKDPKHKPYGTNYEKIEAVKGKGKKTNLPEMITAEKWDIVTIQQGSVESWDEPKYYPAADKLIAYIKEKAPQAEIVIQQTWAYRCDDPRISGAKPTWKFDQKGMYDNLTKAYTNLAKKYKLRVIPVGFAVQCFREAIPADKKYVAPTAEQLAAFKKPALPDSSGDVVGSYSWRTKGKAPNKTDYITSDKIHLNKDGQYLQACVWYGTLFGEDPAQIKYAPKGMKADRAAMLRTAAAKAVKEFPQVKK